MMPTESRAPPGVPQDDAPGLAILSAYLDPEPFRPGAGPAGVWRVFHKVWRVGIVVPPAPFSLSRSRHPYGRLLAVLFCLALYGGAAPAALAVTVSAVSPNTGPTSGGQTVEITGGGFVNSAGGTPTVTFDGVPATVISFTSTKINVTTPAHAAGVVDIVVTDTGPAFAVGTGAGLYTYSATAPGVTSISPTTGPISGGTAVTITGTNFTGATAVSIGGTAVPSFTVVSATTITTTTPAHAAGSANVDVTTAAGTGTGTALYTYVAPAPAVTSINTSAGPTSGGTAVTITGTSFTGATAVTFGGTPVAAFNVVNDTTITTIAPAHAEPGAVDVAVTTPAGAGVGTGLFTYSLGLSGLTLTTTASPSSFAGAGQLITFTHAVANTSGFVLSGIKVGGILKTFYQLDCVPGTLAAGATATCTQSYTTTLGDVTKGSVAISASALMLVGDVFIAQSPRADLTVPFSIPAVGYAPIAQVRVKDFVAATAQTYIYGPGTTRMHDRLTGTPAVAPSGFLGGGDDSAGTMNFVASLAAQARDDGGLPRPAAKFDIWAEGAFSYYRRDASDGLIQGHAGVLYAGADYLVAPNLLLGVMGQFDRAKQSSDTVIGDAGGQGWMAGPYLSARLTPHLFLDARALWGRSEDHISVTGAFTDNFETSRALASARLTGEFSYGALTLRPSAEAVYLSVNQDAYTSGIGIVVGAQTISIARLQFGPEVSYRFDLGGGGTLEPFVGLKGQWGMTKSNAVDGGAVGDGWSGRVEAGATLQLPTGVTMRATGSYDGLGGDVESWGGRASVVVPLP